MSKADFFLNKTLGEDFFESLSKSEIWKPGTKSVNDIEDMRVGLKIVPRVIISWLVRELSPMLIGDNKRIALPVKPNAFVNVTKHERDQYSGDIEHDNKKVTEFKFRSLPGLGLVIMSTFELYSIDELAKPSEEPSEVDSLKIQRMVDERLALHDLVGKVVEKKIMEKEAIHELVLAKLTAAIKMVHDNANDALTNSNQALAHAGNALDSATHAHARITSIKKPRPVQEFLEKRQKPQEFAIQLAKGETVECPDCRKNIFDGSAFSGCICLGENMDSKVYIKKSEQGIKVRFGRGWDPENIEMLLEVLRKKK